MAAGDPTVYDLTWQFARTNQVIPFYTIFASRNWSIMKCLGDEAEVGEVYGAKRPWVNGAGAIIPSGSVCGGATDWRFGLTLPYTLVATNGGQPLCCGVFGLVVADGGGVAVGGRDARNVSFDEVESGGVQVGGADDHVTTAVEVESGGVQVGGADDHVTTAVEVESGGVQVGGADAHLVVFVEVESGGVQVGGADAHLVVFVEVESGGVQVGGTDAHSTTSTTTPGSTCSNAPAVTLPFTATYTSAAFPTPQTFKVQMTNGHTYRWKIQINSGTLGGTQWSHGACPGTPLTGSPTALTPCVTYTATATEDLNVQMNANFFGTYNYTIWLDENSCP